MYGDHPFGFPHPWHDPFAPQDIFNPRPDQELAIAGGLAPRPESFPFTDQGRRDYYAAVRAAAQQQMAMQHHHMQQMQAAAEAERAAERRRRNALLLLMP